MKLAKFIFTTFLIILLSTSVKSQKPDAVLDKKLDSLLHKWKCPFKDWRVRIDSSFVLKSPKKIMIYCSKGLSFSPVREESVNELNESLKKILKNDFPSYKLHIYTNQKEYKDLLPNFYRKNTDLDKSRIFFHKKKKVLVKKHEGIEPSKGLYNNYIALWHSHGRYYEPKLDRWEWQRARHFTTVEDILPMSFVLPYLAPMLENAGATVLIPRERDIQKNEIIVDNDVSSNKSEFILSDNIRKTVKEIGFLKKDTLFSGDNPFTLGSSLKIIAAKNSDVASYIPYFAEGGEYGVYVSFKQQDKTAIAQYSVYHSGGVTSFDVNQIMGGGTWIYLGTFKFDKGKNPKTSKIEVISKKGKISLDAIKIGGGMGNVARRKKNNIVTTIKHKHKVKKWKTSKKPRYLEGSRYWLQYAGMPEYVYNPTEGKDDYKDDYQSRGLWVNYLNGTVRSQVKNKIKHGLNIPVDLSLAFHTDAGLTRPSIIGTLAIYSTLWDGNTFPNKQSKLASRDLTDIIQTQIVSDIRKLYHKNWTRRQMWDAEYNEAWKPNVPAMLLELLSHQNLTDMRLGLDPRFRFDASRAIYKGILKFQTFQENRDYVVQPLPVNSLAINRINEHEFELSWQAVIDSLEPTAEPTKYKIYKRVGEKGFDNGIELSEKKYKFRIDEYGKIVSFKVTAINDGGESMPSEILSVGLRKRSTSTVLVVNAFDRICAPSIINKNGFAGVEWWNDEGVAHNSNIAFTGNQYDFNPNKKWTDDDNPGWGSSYGNMEGKAIPGNTFDFVYSHGEAIMAAGHSFISVSDEAFNSTYNTDNYNIIDIILGEEKSTPMYKDSSIFEFEIYTKAFMDKIKELVNRKANILISGAYIGTDIKNNKKIKDFVKQTMHYRHMTNHAVKTGEFYAVEDSNNEFEEYFEFNTNYLPELYKVEAPDAIEPVGEGAKTIFRYSENNTSAGIAFEGDYKLIAFGFPFETIIKKSDRFKLMSQILKFFDK